MTTKGVTSRILCKFKNGLILPGFIQMTDYSKDNAVNTCSISKAANSTGSPSHFTERPLYDIGSSDLHSVRQWTIQKIQ